MRTAGWIPCAAHGLVKGGVELAFRALEQHLCVVFAAAQFPAGASQQQGDRDEVLLGSVMEVALESSSLTIRGIHEPLSGGPQLGLRLLAFCDVAEVPREERRARRADPRDRQLDRELGPVRAQPHDFDSPVEDRRHAGLEEAREPPAMLSRRPGGTINVAMSRPRASSFA